MRQGADAGICCASASDAATAAFLPRPAVRSEASIVTNPVCLWTAIMTPQWRGLVNGTVVYILFGVIAMVCQMFISNVNKP